MLPASYKRAEPVAKAPEVKPSTPVAKQDAAPVPASPQPPPQAAPLAKPNAEPPRPTDTPAESSLTTAKPATPVPSAPPLAETRRGGSPSVNVPPLPKQDPDSVQIQIEQSEMLLRIGNVKGAREALDRGVKAGHPDALVALARTYDPLELSTLLVPPGVDDVPAAVKLYSEAVAKGSRAAKVKLDRLLAATASEPSQPRKK